MDVPSDRSNSGRGSDRSDPSRGRGSNGKDGNRRKGTGGAGRSSASRAGGARDGGGRSSRGGSNRDRNERGSDRGGGGRGRNNHNGDDRSRGGGNRDDRGRNDRSRGRDDRGRNDRGRDDRGRDGRGRYGGDDRAPRRPKTEAERRAAEVAARRPPRAPRDREAEQRRIEERTLETWIDEGSTDEARRIRAAASGAATRAKRSGEGPSIDPDDKRALTDALGPARGERLAERLEQAARALDRDRYQEARRVSAAVIKEAPDIAAAQQILGLANYRLGYWKPAATALERANELHLDPATLPVLADCYRALRRWSAVERTWLELRSASPAHDVLAEGRIVAAGAQADRGDLRGALTTMEPATKRPKTVRDHHLRQWYVLGDLSDRVGDPIAARRWFSQIADHDPAFADVDARLRSLGR